jgi:hypothetical protein
VSASPHARKSIIAQAMIETLYEKCPPVHWRGGDQARRLQLRGETTLSRKVAKCRPDDRCLSPGCLQCGAAEQAVIAKATKKYVRGADECEVAFITIVPRRSRVPIGNLLEFDVDNFARRIRDGLAKTNAQWGIGAIDLTINTHRDGSFDPFWQPHAALMAGAESLDELKSQLRATFPGDDLTPRPVLMKEWDGRTAVFPYLHKPNFSQRITVEDQLRHNKTTGEWRTCRATTYSRLRAAEELEIARFLDRVGLGGRLLLRNLRLRGSKGSFWLE